MSSQVPHQQAVTYFFTLSVAALGSCPCRQHAQVQWVKNSAQQPLSGMTAQCQRQTGSSFPPARCGAQGTHGTTCPPGPLAASLPTPSLQPSGLSTSQPFTSLPAHTHASGKARLGKVSKRTSHCRFSTEPLPLINVCQTSYPACT